MTVVLAGSFQETAAFTEQVGLRNIFHISSRTQIAGLRPDVIHVLPGFYTRGDYHAVNLELKKITESMHSVTQRVDWARAGKQFVRADSPEGKAIEEYLEQHGYPVDPKPKKKRAPRAKSAVSTPAAAEIQDTSKDAVPGQLAIDEVIPELADRLSLLEAMADDAEPDDDAAAFFSMLDGAS